MLNLETIQKKVLELILVADKFCL